jgi:archaellum component FlaD/FlaE
LLQQFNIRAANEEAAEDCEDEEEDYDTQNEDDEGDEQDEEAEEADDIVDEEENDLECYLRTVGIENGRIRARTAPLRPME